MTAEMTLRFEAPDWMADRHANGEWQHLVGFVDVGVNGSNYYKAVLVNEDGEERWWVWKDQERMMYGPQFEERERKVLSTAVDALK